MSNRLTPAAARELKPKQSLRDHEVTGLQLIGKATCKVWFLYYRTRDGQERRPRLGSFPEMTVSAAREAAKELKERVARGEDPSRDWQASRGVPTVSDLCDRYLAEWASKRLADNSYKQHEHLIQVQIKPGLGSRRVTDVTSLDVDRFLEKVFNREFVGGGGTAHWTAHHAKKLLAKLFKRVNKFYGIRLDQDPMQDTIVYGRIKRKRHATAEELPVISTVIDNYAVSEPRRAAFFWVLFLTGGRVSEILNLTRGQIEARSGNRHIILFTKHKTMKHIGDKEVILPKPALQILEALDFRAMKPSERVFGDMTIRSAQRVWQMLRNEAGCQNLKLLDARRTFASFALSHGLSLEQVGELLGHTDVQTTKGYAYLIDEMKHRGANTAADAITSMKVLQNVEKNEAHS